MANRRRAGAEDSRNWAEDEWWVDSSEVEGGSGTLDGMEGDRDADDGTEWESAGVSRKGSEGERGRVAGWPGGIRGPCISSDGAWLWRRDVGGRDSSNART